MDFKNPRRGAAGVSIVWMVSVIVFLLVALGVAFVSADESAKKDDIIASARAEKVAAEAAAETERKRYIALSELVGFSEAGLVAQTDSKQVEEALSNLKSSFPDMDDGTVDTVEAAMPKAIEAYNNALTKNRNLAAEVARLQGEVSSRDSQISNLNQTKDSEIDDLRTQLTDQKQGSDDRIANLENERENLRNQVKDKDKALKSEQGKLEDLEKEAREAKSRAESRMAEMGSKLAFLREPELADGAVLAVSTDASLGWIDLGNQNRLARGTKFRVVSGKKAKALELARKEKLAEQAGEGAPAEGDE